MRERQSGQRFPRNYLPNLLAAMTHGDALEFPASRARAISSAAHRASRRHMADFRTQTVGDVVRVTRISAVRPMRGLLKKRYAELEIGGVLYVLPEQERCARACAWKYGREWECRFTVTKTADEIIVKRIA